MKLFSLVKGVAIIGVALSLCAPVLAEVEQQPPTAPPAATDKTPETPPALEPGVTTQPETEETTPETQLVPRITPEDIQISIPPIARTLEFTGNTVVSSEDLEKATGIKRGQLVTEEILSAAVQNIEKLYQARGYVGSVASVDLPSGGLAGPVVFRIQELKISEVRIEGLVKTREAAIRRMLSVHQGQLFNRSQVVRDYLQLQQLGIFQDVTFSLQPTATTGEAALVWKVTELDKFNYYDLGGDFASGEGLTLGVRLNFGNFRGRAERLGVGLNVSSIDGQLGGQVDYFNPWIAAKNTTLTLSAYSSVRYRFGEDIVPSEDRYFERRTGFRSAVGRLLKPYLTGTAGLRYESVNTHNLPTDLLNGQTVADGSLLLGSLRGTWDFRNSALDPSAGTYTIGFIEGGPSHEEGKGTNWIAKPWIDHRRYIPLRKTELDPVTGLPKGLVPVLAIRGIGAVSTGRLPFYEQYFVGGISDLTLRGYLEGRFWGKYAAVANTEYRYPFNRRFAGVAFVDAGDAWGSDYQFEPGLTVNTDFEQHNSFSPKVGAGVGIRYATPVGPLRLDFAWGDEFRTHISVGQTF